MGRAVEEGAHTIDEGNDQVESDKPVCYKKTGTNIKSQGANVKKKVRKFGGKVEIFLSDGVIVLAKRSTT